MSTTGPTPRRLRRPSYATVASSIALGVALCTGSAVAAATIGSAQIKPNAVLSRHIDDGAVRSRDIHRGAVTAGKVGHDAIGGANVAADALEGDDIDESTLGPVPVAASLSGVPVTALMGATVTKVESALQPGTLLGDGTYVISQDCPGGSTLLAGGPANVRSTSILLESFPSPGTTNGWTARINKQGVDDDFSVVLLCASRSA